MSQTLPFALQVRLTAAQRGLLERVSASQDLTLSGAVRHVLDQELAREDAELAAAGFVRMDDGSIVDEHEAARLDAIEAARSETEA